MTSPPEYPQDTEVEVRYPLSKEQETGPRSEWPWLPGTVTEVCGLNEWQVVVEHPDLAVTENGGAWSPKNGDPWYPLCFRDSSEIRIPDKEAEAQ
jgi:hypothetical protein